MRKLSIIQMISSPWWTGAADPALFLTVDLHRRGHLLHFVCIPGHDLEKRAVLAGFPPVDGVEPTRSLNPLRVWKSVNALANLFDKVEADIVHTHLSAEHWLAFLASKRARRKVRIIRTVHHPRAVKKSVFNRYLFGRATDGIVAVNGYIGELLEKESEVPEEKIHVIRGGIDIERYRPPTVENRASGREILGTPQKTLLIGIVARLAPDRGHMTLLRGFRTLLADMPNVRLVIVGKGEHLPQIKERINELGLAKQIDMPGFVEGDLFDVIASLDIFVLMAPGSEGSCRAVLEAMAMGIPCVVTDRHGLSEIVEDDVTAFVVPWGDHRKLAESFHKLLADKTLRTQFGRAARRRAEQLFYRSRRAELIEKTYAEILGLPLPENEFLRVEAE
jgi:glycosyltransferase involved in cell wall biosynthesis